MSKKLIAVVAVLVGTAAFAGVSIWGSVLRVDGDSYITNATAGQPVKVTDTEGLSINASTPIAGHYLSSAAVDSASIPAGGEVDTAVTVSGLLSGDHVTVMPDCLLEVGVLVKQARATASTTLTVTLYNATGSPVDPASCTFSVQFWR